MGRLLGTTTVVVVVVVDVMVLVVVIVVGCCRVVIVVVVIVGGVLKETGGVTITCHRKLLTNKHGHVDASDHVMYQAHVHMSCESSHLQ